jgi:hypothetical protein
MQTRTRIKITTPVNNVGYELMSKLTNGRSLIYFRERGVEVNDVLQPFSANIRWDNSRYTLDYGGRINDPAF